MNASAAAGVVARTRLMVRWAGGLAPGSHFIFTYIDAAVLDGSARFVGADRLKRTLVRSGEPWTFGLHPKDVAGYLAARGLRLLADQGAADYRPHVMGEQARRIRGYEFYHVAWAGRPC